MISNNSLRRIMKSNNNSNQLRLRSKKLKCKSNNLLLLTNKISKSKNK